MTSDLDRHGIHDILRAQGRRLCREPAPNPFRLLAVAVIADAFADLGVAVRKTTEDKRHRAVRFFEGRDIESWAPFTDRTADEWRSAAREALRDRKKL